MKKLLVLLITAAAVCGSCEEERSRDCDIIAFTVDGTAWTIDGTTIAHTYPSGTAATPLTPVVAVSEGATVSPASGTAQPLFSAAGVDYVVTAADGITTKTYTAKATIAGSPGDGRQVSRLTRVGNPNAIYEDERDDIVIEFGYDAQNRLTSLKGPLYDGDEDAEVHIAYAGDRVTVTGITVQPSSTDIGMATMVGQLNGSGYLVSATATTVWSSGSPNSVGTMTATYDADGYLTGYAVAWDGQNEKECIATWTAGNLTRMQESTTEYSIAQYNAGLNRASIDLNWLVYTDPNFNFNEYTLFAIAGLCGRRSQNMVAQTTEHYGSDSSGTYIYTYTFDSEGYVTQWTSGHQGSGSPMVYRVEYRQ